MRKTLILSGVACAVLLISLHARAKQTTATEDGYQAATVVSVTKNLSGSSYIGGDNPSDAPLQAREYSYDIAIRVNCNVYVGRYESATRYLPSVFAPHHEVDVRLQKHIMYVSLPLNDDEVMMGIVGHKSIKNEVCAQGTPKALASRTPSQQSTQSESKGGLS